MLLSHSVARRLIALFVVVILFAAAGPVGAVTTKDLKAAQDKAKENRNKIREGEADKERLRNNIREADTQLDKTQNDLEGLEQQLVETRAERNKITAILNEIRAQLAVNEAELKTALRELDRLSGILNKRAGDVYKNGDVSFLEVLLDASSFIDFINRARFLQTIMAEDARLISDIKATKKKIEQSREQIQRDKDRVQKEENALSAQVDQMAALTNAVRAKKNQLQGQISSKKGLIAGIESDQKRWEIAAAEYDRSAAKINALLSQSSQPTFISGSPSASGFIWPATGSLTSRFGPRWGRNHNGLDIAAPTGTPVAASKAGKVIIASWYGGYGNLVVIDHGGGVSTWYGHNSAFSTSVGQQVTRGQVIAKMGSTGNSTGPHVHFEIRFNGNPYDPLPYLP